MKRVLLCLCRKCTEVLGWQPEKLFIRCVVQKALCVVLKEGKIINKTVNNE